MTWKIDPTRSQIGFAIRKLKLFTVHGTFTPFRWQTQIRAIFAPL